MTKERLCARIEELEDATEESLRFMHYGEVRDAKTYYEGFVAACEEIKEIINWEWDHDG